MKQYLILVNEEIYDSTCNKGRALRLLKKYNSLYGKADLEVRK